MKKDAFRNQPNLTRELLARRQIFLSGEGHSVYDPAHFWLGINLHLSFCNLSEGMRGTLP